MLLTQNRFLFADVDINLFPIQEALVEIPGPYQAITDNYQISPQVLQGCIRVQIILCHAQNITPCIVFFPCPAGPVSHKWSELPVRVIFRW